MKSITKNELKAMNEKEHEDFVLINVLHREDFNEKHIRTSVNVAYDDPELAEKVEEIAGDKSRKLVLYCASFDCPASTKASEKLEEAGFTRVYDYEGGTKDWFEQKAQAA